MARARNIKPGFFKNEELAECTPWGRLCFAGLWTLADREGRLEDRPKRIKGELFAYDSVEVDPLLIELAGRGFILRYDAPDGRKLIQIIEFAKHQNPHHREPESELPPPQSPGPWVVAKKDKPRADARSEDNKAQGQAGIGPGLSGDDPAMHEPQAVLIPDSGALIPDTGARIPDSNSVPDGTGGEPPADSPLDRPTLWKVIKDLLQRAGVAKSACGGIITDLIAKHTEPVVMEAMQGIARHPPPGDIREYLPATCQHLAGQRRHPNRQEALEQRNRTVADSWAAEGEVDATV